MLVIKNHSRQLKVKTICGELQGDCMTLNEGVIQDSVSKCMVMYGRKAAPDIPNSVTGSALAVTAPNGLSEALWRGCSKHRLSSQQTSVCGSLGKGKRKINHRCADVWICGVSMCWLECVVLLTLLQTGLGLQ